MIRYELYFGRSVKTPSVIGLTIEHQVSDDDWERFVDDSIVPRFDGFSEHDLTGYWEGEKERTKKVEIMANGGPIDKGHIMALRGEYCRRFKQESVMLVMTDVEVLF